MNQRNLSRTRRGARVGQSPTQPWIVATAAIGGLVLVFTLCVFVFSSHAEAGGSGPVINSATQLAQARARAGNPPIMSRPEGALGITPHLNLDTANAAVANLPTYTAADATAWVLAHPQSFLLKSVTPPTAADVTVKFMTDAGADQVLDIAIGLPATAPVCVVQMRGNFRQVFNPTNSPNLKNAPVMYLVFDGRSGNLLVVGGRAHPFFT